MSNLIAGNTAAAVWAPREGLAVAGVEIPGPVTLVAGNTAAATWAPSAQTAATSATAQQ